MQTKVTVGTLQEIYDLVETLKCHGWKVEHDDEYKSIFLLRKHHFPFGNDYIRIFLG